MFQTLLTQDKVEELGFVDYNAVRAVLLAAFGQSGGSTATTEDGERSKAFRLALIVTQWVALSQRFGVAKAERW